MYTYTTKLKTAILGSSSTGKTSIVMRLLRNEFGKTDSTIGASFFTLDIDDIRYEVWDTAGSERFLSLAPMYYRGAKIVIMVFDLSDLSTIDRVISYIGMIERTAQYLPKFIIVGNKSDLLSEKQIYDVTAFVSGKLPGYDIVYTSAKNGSGITELKSYLIKNGELLRGEVDNRDIILSDKYTETNEKSDCEC